MGPFIYSIFSATRLRNSAWDRSAAAELFRRCRSNINPIHIQHARESSVVECFIWSKGMVALTDDLKLIAVTDFANPRPQTLASPSFQQLPFSWTVLPPHQSPTNELEIFLAVENTIFSVNSSRAQNQLLSNGPFKKIALSPNGKFLAMASDRKIWVVTADFQRNVVDVALDHAAPDQLCWCGADAVVGFWSRESNMVVASISGGSMT